VRRVWPRVCVLALAVLATAGGARADEEDDAERFINELYPVEFRVRVNQSIERGVQWLKGAQRPDGSWSFMNYQHHYPAGPSALATLTLLKCGVKPDDEVITRAFAFLRNLPIQRTYSAAVLLMALDAKYAPARDPFAEDDTDKYGHLKEQDPCAKVISKEDKAWMQAAVDFLVEQQTGNGVWRYPHDGYDLSNTQFALLGLHAATRCGITIDNRIWLDALRYVLDAQEKTGEPIEYRANEVRGRYRFEWIERAMTRGFTYIHGPHHSLAMTTAGLTALVCCQNRLWRSRAYTASLRVEVRRGMRDALAWIQHNFSVTHNTHGDPRWHFYGLYGLERCGILGRFRFVGMHDWYREGADYLLQNQTPAGHWSSGHLWEDNCFALLFLKRATSRMDAPVITPSGGPDSNPALAPETGPNQGKPTVPEEPEEHLLKLGYWIKRLKSSNPQLAFRATIRLGAMGDRRAADALIVTVRAHTDPYVRVGAIVALSKLRSCDAVPYLIDEGLFDAEDLVRHAAQHALVRITGHRDLGYLSGMTRNERMRLKKQWLAWWDANEAAVRNRYGQ
jgi:hypothetical protein